MSLVDKNNRSKGGEGRTPSYFDIPYGVASVAATLGTTVVSTTGADYHGIALITTSAGATVKVFDSTGTVAGNILDMLLVGATVSTRSTFYSPVKAKKGIVVSMTLATGASGVVFYAPKG